MPKPESWRLDAASYPVHVDLQTRFQDMDINGHLNNVAFAALFESGRVLLNREIRPWEERPANERTMVAAVEINYLAEGNFPDPVLIAWAASTSRKVRNHWADRTTSARGGAATGPAGVTSRMVASALAAARSMVNRAR